MMKYLRALSHASEILEFLALVITALEDKKLTEAEITDLVNRGYALALALGLTPTEVTQLARSLRVAK